MLRTKLSDIIADPFKPHKSSEVDELKQRSFYNSGRLEDGYPVYERGPDKAVVDIEGDKIIREYNILRD